jgi:hypothetical protein
MPEEFISIEKEMKKLDNKELEKEKSAESRKNAIFGVAKEFGISEDEVETNGYWYKIPYDNVTIFLVDQGERVVLDIVNPGSERPDQEAGIRIHKFDLPETMERTSAGHILRCAPEQALRSLLGQWHESR